MSIVPAFAQSSSESVSFYRDVLPVFQAKCHGCHQPAKSKGGYVMTDFRKLVAGGDSGDRAVIPGNPEDSRLLTLITPVDGEAEMPQKGEPLSEPEIQKIRSWIAQGAKNDSPQSQGPRFTVDQPPVYSRPAVITSIDFSPDGQLMAVAGFHEVLLHQADGSGLVGRLVGMSERIESVRFSPDGSRLAVTGGLPARMGEIQFWDVASQTLELSKSVTYDTVYGGSWSPDGSLFAFGCSDNTVRAMNSNTGEEVLYQGAHNDWVLDTVFSLKGDHVISVGRDQTAKLTEVATERFVDNLTSITPGALKGGIASVVRHPDREEILIGGADGAPQVYRLFRQSKRVIGDNANLVRKFPPMTGRIFGVDYSPDGRHVVAGSSLDGRGWIHLYEADFESELSDELKEIFGKRVAERSAEEKAKIEDYWTQGVSLAGSVSIPAGIYAVAYHPGGEYFAVGGSDGILRYYQADGMALRKAFVAVPLEGREAGDLYTLSVEPSSIDLDHPYEYAQMLVTGWTASGEAIDLTRRAAFEGAEGLVNRSEFGKITGLKNGASQLSISHEGHELNVPVSVRGLDREYRPDYVRDIMPVLSKLGCNAGTCHGAKDGKNGFKLSLRGYDPVYDVRAFSDDLAGRRINRASPANSLMLLKATAAVPHEGGQVVRTDEPYYELLLKWISNGAQLREDSPRVKAIRISPSNPVIQVISGEQQMRVVAVYSDGRERDVSSEAFVESGNTEVAAVAGQGLMRALRRGEAPVLARFEGAYAATTLTVMGDRSGFAWKEPEKWSEVDEFVAAKWKRMKILPSDLCGDAEFVRRVHLDLTGLPPSPETVLAFLQDERPVREKRTEMIEELIGSNPYIDYWTNKWADLLQVNRKFLGAEGAKLFRDWIRVKVAANTPYDQFVHEILTATGSNREHPEASYFKVLRTPEETMENTTHLFLATRFNCNKCHDHPFERWTQDQYYQLSSYFARVSFKKDPESGDKRIGGTAVEGSKPLYEIVFDEPEGEVVHQRTGKVAAPEFPFRARYSAEEAETRREALAGWITSRDNPYFAKSYVNRVWGYLMGVGLIEPIDDIRAGNPPSNPELLNWLTRQFVDSGFDVRQLMKTICSSRAYQLSIESNSWNEDDAVNFSHATPKRLPAEVLYDAIYFTTGAPTKFPGLPEGVRASQLPDSGVKLDDGFLGTLGRPPRESACECERSNDLQLGGVMSLVSGPTVDAAVSDPHNKIAELAQLAEDERQLIEKLVLRMLSRPAKKEEVDQLMAAFERIDVDHQGLAEDYRQYLDRIAPELERREDDWLAAIDRASDELAAYEKEIAPHEAERDRERLTNIEKAEKELDAYDAQLVESQTQWEADPNRASKWSALDPIEMTGSNDSKLTLQKDYSVLASGKNGDTVYELLTRIEPGTWTGVRLEALTHESLPKNGPGRADGDGNFVLTEIEVYYSGGDNPDSFLPIKLKNARADFSQGGLEAAKAVDGDKSNNNGWAIAPQTGKDHQATFELDAPIQLEREGLLKFVLTQNYQSRKHSLGRFRLSATASETPLDFGIPKAIDIILALSKDERTEEQNTELARYYKNQDSKRRELAKQLAEAKKPRPMDPGLKMRRDNLARLSEPLPKDAQLAEFERALELSREQRKNKRLTAAQDIAWALINNPAFLFNH